MYGTISRTSAISPTILSLFKPSSGSQLSSMSQLSRGGSGYSARGPQQYDPRMFGYTHPEHATYAAVGGAVVGGAGAYFGLGKKAAPAVIGAVIGALAGYILVQ